MVGSVDELRRKLSRVPRRALASVPTPLTSCSIPAGQALVKRDDLIGPGMGGNKVRKLEFLLGDALANGADCLVTVGAAQSNHARLTAAVGAMEGLETHLVLGGSSPAHPSGNQLLEELFGARMHFPGTNNWDELEAAQDDLALRLEREGRKPYRMPIGGSTPVGALGFVAAFDELMTQCGEKGIHPSLIVHASSSGGTHAGLLAGRAVYAMAGGDVPGILAISVAKTERDLAAHALQLAREALQHIGLGSVPVTEDAVRVDGRWRGSDYAVPTVEGDHAIVAASRAGLVLDRVYTGKAFAGMLDISMDDQRTGELIFWHTGGQPALFAQDGFPHSASSEQTNIRFRSTNRSDE